MDFGMIGLGRMGANMQRLASRGHACVAHDHEPKAVAALHAGNDADAIVAAILLADIAARLAPPRVVWRSGAA